MTSRITINAAHSIRPILGGVALVLVFLLAVAAASAEVDKVYSATHSLTGDCNTSSVDPVADPGCPGSQPPAEAKLIEPLGVFTDGYGDTYVLDGTGLCCEGTHVPIFSPSGRYITSLALPYQPVGEPEVIPLSIAVDSTGHVYVYLDERGAPNAVSKIVRYDPTTYEPQAGRIDYASSPVVVAEGSGQIGRSMAVDPTDDHLFFHVQSASSGAAIAEYGPPTDGLPNELLDDTIGVGVLARAEGAITIDHAHHKIYVADWPTSTSAEVVVKVLNLDPPHQLLGTIDGSTTPAGKLSRDFSVLDRLQLGVDEASGTVFAGSLYGNRALYEFEASGAYLGAISRPPFEDQFAHIAVDNSPASPDKGYLYIPSGQGQAGHMYAYEPYRPPTSPVVESVSATGVAEEEAVLGAVVNPEGAATHYVFEYTTQADYVANGFVNAMVAGTGDVPLGGEGVAVSAPASGLTPGTAYRFRVRVENQCQAGGCAAEREGSFTTFAPYAQSGACSNQVLRTGPSVLLPDCRAYELVSPPETDGRPPYSAPGGGGGGEFGTWNGSPDGGSVGFMVNGGGIPGFPGTGSFGGDVYVSRRGTDAWRTESAEPNGDEIQFQNVGSLSSDHNFDMINAVTLENENVDYIRYADGSFHLVGEGSMGSEPLVRVRYISAGGQHTIFETGELSTSPVQLEPEAAPSGTVAIYDRALDGKLRVVSLLPGNVSLGAKEPAQYDGVSADGSAVAFTVNSTSPLYLRVDDSETLEAAPVGSRFAGISSDGRYLFYLSGGDLYRFDAQSRTSTRITESSDVLPVNVSSEGAGAYFISPSVLGEGPNPNEAEPVSGRENLYYWDGSRIRFVATVTQGDVEDGSEGFVAWMESPSSPGWQISRSSADGSTLLFESWAALTPSGSGGKRQIYRYDSGEGTLLCVSCIPTGKASSTDAALLTVGNGGPGTPVTSYSIVANLSRDGSRAFFESEEQLVPADIDGVRDVYEWEADGRGSCAQQDGCLFLISSGRSPEPSYLFGASESGDDVFILSDDILTGEDGEATASIYDARASGGFPPPAAAAGECQGEACQPAAVALNDPTPGSFSFEGAGNVKKTSTPRCLKGRRATRRGGQFRCVKSKKTKKRHRHRRHRRTNAKGRAHR